MSVFYLKYFSIRQEVSAMKVGTDAMVLGALVLTDGSKSILDVGTGTGILALICAQKNQEAQIVGLELDPFAVAESAGNFQNAPWSDRLLGVSADFLNWNPSHRFDLILSNPPYYQTSKSNADDRLKLARHVGELTPERFFDRVNALLIWEGACELIVPAQDDAIWNEAANECGFNLVRRITVFGKRGSEAKRRVLRFQRSKDELEESELTIREVDGNYTQEYIELTRDFHGVEL